MVKYALAVRFTDELPDISLLTRPQHVEIDPVGPARVANEMLTNAAAGLDRKPDGYAWHHKEEGTVQLVPANLHLIVGHHGGCSIERLRGDYT